MIPPLEHLLTLVLAVDLDIEFSMLAEESEVQIVTASKILLVEGYSRPFEFRREERLPELQEGVNHENTPSHQAPGGNRIRDSLEGRDERLESCLFPSDTSRGLSR